jgi:hypothetical protein
MMTLDEIDVLLQQDDHEQALPQLLAHQRETGSTRMLDLAIMQCVRSLGRVPGLSDLAGDFSSRYGAEADNEIMALCEAYCAAEEPERGLDVLRVYTFSNPNTVVLTYYQSMFLLQMGNIAKARDGFLQCIEQGFPDTGVVGGLALSYFLLGEYEKTVEVIRQQPAPRNEFANNLYYGDRYTEALRDGMTELDTYTQRINLLSDEEALSAPDTSFRLMVSGDGVYLRRYLEGFLRSVEQVTSSLKIHVHAITKDQSDIQFVQNAIDHSPTMDISCSCEQEDEVHSGKTYYATARFMALYTLYQRFGIRGSVYMLDIDSELVGDLAELQTFTEGADVGLRLRNEIFLEQRIAAGGVYLSGSPASKAFIHDVASYIAFGLFKDKPYWYLDQLALVMVNAEIECCEPTPIIASLPRKFLDWQGFDDSIVKTSKGEKDQ